jgi:hypothetical protein
LSRDEAVGLAADAFVFGYPLVLMDASRAVFMNAPRPDGGGQPANELSHLRTFPDASFTQVVSPNADTLYSTAWLELAAEPIVLTTPASAGRYYLMPLLSAWTDVVASPGTRTTGEDAGAFAITGPDWEGELPLGLQEIRAPTSMAWIIGRTQTNGKADYEAVHRFQDALSLVPLSAWGSEPAPPAARPVDPGVDLETPPPVQVAAMDAAAFLGRLATLMVDNPPAADDAPALERFAAIGLSPGAFAPGPGLADALDEGMRHGMAGIRAALQHPPDPTDGWSISRDIGSYGTDYAKRAMVALVGLGANLNADAIYPHTSVDGDGEALNGAHRYVLRFPPGRTPPARAFWSLTMYDEHQYFVDNPLGRYAIGDRDPLAVNADGSLDLWLQRESPGPERESNWLPAPSGPFNLILRIYWPEQPALDGTWTPPGIEKLA